MFLINEKTIFKKFLTENTLFFLLISLCVSFIITIIQSVNNLDLVLEDGHSFLIYFYYTLLLYPKIIGKILPLIFFTSLFYTFNKYENTNSNVLYKIRFNIIVHPRLQLRNKNYC